MERRGTQVVADSAATPATRRGGSPALTGVESIATRARSQPAEPFTALLHHFSVENLRACFQALDGKKAPGVDGVTKADYAQDLESNLQALHHVGEFPPLSAAVSAPPPRSADLSLSRGVNGELKRLVREIRRQASVRERLPSVQGRML